MLNSYPPAPQKLMELFVAAPILAKETESARNQRSAVPSFANIVQA